MTTQIASVALVSDMQRFWDEKAREDAAFFVDDRLEYGNPDWDRFWAGGEEVLGHFEAALEFTISGGELVEIGCGLGRLTRALVARGAMVRALDVSEEMIRRARELTPENDSIEWVHGDGVSLGGIGDASADGVFSHVVFQHIPDPAITLGYVAEMGRVLRPGGWAAFQVSTDPDIHDAARAPARQKLKAALGRAPKGQDHPAWVGSAVDPAALRETAERAGLAVERVANEGTQFTLVLLTKR